MDNERFVTTYPQVGRKSVDFHEVIEENDLKTFMFGEGGGRRGMRLSHMTHTRDDIT